MKKAPFLSEMANVADTISGPWIVIGDFNLVRDPSDKNTPSFDASEAALFNDLINNIGWIEIPLSNRSYTWSNKQACPTLVRLDRCFVNDAWDALFPNTSLSLPSPALHLTMSRSWSPPPLRFPVAQAFTLKTPGSAAQLSLPS